MQFWRENFEDTSRGDIVVLRQKSKTFDDWLELSQD